MAGHVVAGIRESGLTIYDVLESRPELFIDHQTLEDILNAGLVGFNLYYQLRTRSKIVKARICEILGYPVPKSFRRTQPRFPGQSFDTYVQKANNLQIWNEQVSASRRYVLIRVDELSIVTKVRVVTGEVLARLDTTGKLTHKYQAKARASVTESCLVASADSPNVDTKLIQSKHPKWPNFIPIAKVFSRLKGLVGTVLPDPGRDQERNRGGVLHRVVCQRLGLPSWKDDGQFPDITEQLLEVKLQTAATIDLGLVCPDSTEHIADFPEFNHGDVRYSVFYGTLVSAGVRLDHVVLTPGAMFFTYFQRFGGNVKNAKLQIPLPSDFFA